MSKKQRLDKVLANMGYGSRREVRSIIKSGLVSVNNKVILENGYKVDPYQDLIYCKGEKILYRKHIYLMMNKPKGLVCSTDDPVNKTVMDILDKEYLNFRPFPAGRLDKDTEGLLLITNDGKLAHELLSPKKEVYKKYLAIIDGHIKKEHVDLFKKGITLDDGYQCLPSYLEIIKAGSNSKVFLSIREGKFHQVKRMFRSLSMEVLYLKRVAMGNLTLDKGLNPGEYRELKEKELNLLKNI